MSQPGSSWLIGLCLQPWAVKHLISRKILAQSVLLYPFSIYCRNKHKLRSVEDINYFQVIRSKVMVGWYLQHPDLSNFIKQVTTNNLVQLNLKSSGLKVAVIGTVDGDIEHQGSDCKLETYVRSIDDSILVLWSMGPWLVKTCVLNI